LVLFLFGLQTFDWFFSVSGTRCRGTLCRIAAILLPPAGCEEDTASKDGRTIGGNDLADAKVVGKCTMTKQ
jgi:hypothetical protein